MHFCQCHHHSWGGAPLLTTTICIARAPCSHLPSRPRLCLGTQGEWDRPATQRAGLRSGVAEVLLGIACIPTGGGWGTSLVITQVIERGLGCEERGRGRFCKKTLLCKRKSAVESSLPHFREKPDSPPGDRPHLCLLRSPMQSLVLRARACSGLKPPRPRPWPPQGTALMGPLSTIQVREFP